MAESLPPGCRLRVAICGGGIGGLTLAWALARYADVQIDIYEAAARFEEIGAGLAIWGRGVTVLKKLGLEERLRAIAPGPAEPTNFEVRKADVPTGGETLGHLAFSNNLGFHRAQFVQLLVDLLSHTGRATTHFRKRCVSFAQGGDVVTLQFADGTAAGCDVLVGCDGIKSAVRRELMRAEASASPGPPAGLFPGTVFSGTVAYRALVKPDELRAVAGEHSAMTVRRMYCGKDKHIVTYPVAGGRFINFIAYSSSAARHAEWERGLWVVQAPHDEVLAQFGEFEPEVQALLQCVGSTSRWAMYEVEPLPFWSKGRVTLLGDAAHGMTPFIGAGGGQGIEDVYILCALLGSPHTTRDTLPAALRAYEHVRRPRAAEVLRCTREARRVLEAQGEYAGKKGEGAAEAMQGLTRWLWEDGGEGLAADVEEAEGLARGGC